MGSRLRPIFKLPQNVVVGMLFVAVVVVGLRAAAGEFVGVEFGRRRLGQNLFESFLVGPDFAREGVLCDGGLRN